MGRSKYRVPFGDNEWTDGMDGWVWMGWMGGSKYRVPFGDNEWTDND